MEKKGFIFIPDISGFTHFVNGAELEHSSHIIKKLLDTIIAANKTDLKISEIEGDSIVFYQLGEIPDLEIVYAQVERMFLSLRKHLLLYERNQTYYCNAFTTAINLSLKIISFFGEFTEYNVGDFKQLIGKDVIIVHQLLKNDIIDNEYWLISSSLSEKLPSVFKPWMQ